MTALDTNLLLRYGKPTDPQHAVAVAAMNKLLAAGEVLCIFAQNIYEFWATATRPQTANGFGWDVPTTRHMCGLLQTNFTLLPDQPGLFAEWERLVVVYQCHGRVSFDARIVAAMNTHGLARLLTFNSPDFARYPGLTVLDPAAV